MAREATRLACENGGSGRLVERIEHHPLLRIVRRELEDGGARDVADGNRLVKEDGARVVRAGESALHARFREHQQLRIHRHPERVEHRTQIPGADISLEGSPVLRERLTQLRHTVRRRPGRVLDAWMFVEDAGPFLVLLAGYQGAGGECHAERRGAPQQPDPP